MRLEILTADVLEAMNAQEIYQLIQEHSLGEFSELEKQYKSKHEKLLDEISNKELTFGQKMLRFESIIENRRRALAMHGFYRLKSMNATVEQISEVLGYDAKSKEDMENYKAGVLGQKK